MTKGGPLKYLVTGCTRINDLNYPDGRTVKGFLGGAIYAVNGIKPYCDDVYLISTAGPDFDNFYGDYFRTNQISIQGMQFILPKTEYTILDYAEDGRWWEYSKYGEDYEKKWFPKALIKSDYVLEHADQDTLGIYFESGVRESVWQDIDRIRKSAPGAKIMWELPTGDCEKPNLKLEVLALLKNVDIYSLNLPESLRFFETNTEVESIDAITALGIPCFFRVGEKGAYMIVDGNVWFAPAFDVEKSVDATGCGNCSTGAALFGFCEGLHPLMTIIKANLAASLNAQQYGPYPQFTKDLRNEINLRAEQLFTTLIKEQ